MFSWIRRTWNRLLGRPATALEAITPLQTGMLIYATSVNGYQLPDQVVEQLQRMVGKIKEGDVTIDELRNNMLQEEFSKIMDPVYELAYKYRDRSRHLPREEWIHYLDAQTQLIDTFSSKAHKHMVYCVAEQVIKPVEAMTYVNEHASQTTEGEKDFSAYGFSGEA